MSACIASPNPLFKYSTQGWVHELTNSWSPRATDAVLVAVAHRLDSEAQGPNRHPKPRTPTRERSGCSVYCANHSHIVIDFVYILNYWSMNRGSFPQWITGDNVGRYSSAGTHSTPCSNPFISVHAACSNPFLSVHTSRISLKHGKHGKRCTASFFFGALWRWMVMLQAEAAS